MKTLFDLQRFSRALLTPIAVLPLAGLLLRFGQPNLLNWPLMAQAGTAIFSHLALIFAIGVAVGWAKDHHGVVGLAGAVGWLVLNAVLSALNEKINLGVLSGMMCGLMAGALYNRYQEIEFPIGLAFFSGMRRVPIEFSFMFLVPLLYLIHALLSGLTLALTDLLHIRLGMHAGLADVLWSSHWGETPLLLLVTLGYFALYDFIFSFAIRKFNLQTLGREEAEVPPLAVARASTRAHDYITALGGAANLQSVYACATRLRLRLADSAVLDEAWLKRLGAYGIIRLSADKVQVVVGIHAEMLADEILQVVARARVELHPPTVCT